MTPMLNQLTISELASRLGRREVSAREAIEACLKQVESVDPQIHAFLSFDRADALAQADAADRQLRNGPSNGKPLLGVPVAIKDVIAVKGQPLNCASKILKNFVSPYDATVVERLKGAGAVIFGRLNMDEFAMGSSTENSAFFTTLNPWDTTRIPGGSSGGSAAAVAADEAIATLGSDTGGSIRQPPARCGGGWVETTFRRAFRYGPRALASSPGHIRALPEVGRDAGAVMSGLIRLRPLASAH